MKTPQPVPADQVAFVERMDEIDVHVMLADEESDDDISSICDHVQVLHQTMDDVRKTGRADVFSRRGARSCGTRDAVVVWLARAF